MAKRTILTKEDAADSAQVIYSLAASLEFDKNSEESVTAQIIHDSLMDAYIALMSLEEDIVKDIPQDVIDKLVESQKARGVEEDDYVGFHADDVNHK